MAYKKRVKKAFKVGAQKGTTAKKRKQVKGGLKFAKKLDKAIGGFAQKTGVKMVKKGIKTKNKKMVKKGAKTIAGGTAIRAQGAGLRTAMRAGVAKTRAKQAGSRVYKMTAAHKKAISDALRGKKRK
jgi:hypothetical protein